MVDLSLQTDKNQFCQRKGNLPQVIRVGHATLTKQEINQSGWAHASVRVRIRNDAVDQSNAQNFQDRILAETGALAVARPPNVGSDKQSSNQSLLLLENNETK